MKNLLEEPKNEVKHTPGPWLLDGLNINGPFPNGKRPYRDLVAIVEPYNTGREVAEANARLIAAAPELLEALNACPFEVFGRNELGKAWFEKFAKPAITKAEGGAL